MTATSVAEVVARMRAIDAENPPGDGARVFNDVYVRVTESMLDQLRRGGLFSDDAFMSELTVRFANFWFEAYDAGTNTPPAWQPLIAHRSDPGILPIQFALAGMNAHIEHDLPLAVIDTCVARGCAPTTPGVRADYEKVNDLLAGVEAEIRRSFLDQLERAVDDRMGPVAHLVGSWSIQKARDFAWLSMQTLWELRGIADLYQAFSEGLAQTVGMGSRLLLTSLT
ncbi:hypothetical protein EV589_2615 [Mycobacterium sp. BK558]|nr:hypothetical protein EV589_2615 [Mycobacterium sp. BK558]